MTRQWQLQSKMYLMSGALRLLERYALTASRQQLHVMLQAYGAKNFPMVGRVFQRALIIVFVAAVPLTTVLFHAKPLLQLGGQSETVAAMTASYIRHAD